MSAKQILTENNLHESVWGRRIISAESTGKFTSFDLENSADWVTCACGYRSELIETDEIGAPIDSLLFNKGAEFYLSVAMNRYEDAAKALVAIEQRAVMLANST